MADGQQNMDGAVAEEKMEECSNDNQPAQVKSEQKIKMLMYISGARLSYWWLGGSFTLGLDVSMYYKHPKPI